MGKIGDTNEILDLNGPDDADAYPEDYAGDYAEDYAENYAEDYGQDYVEDYVDYGDYYDEEPRPARKRAPARSRKRRSTASTSRSKKAAPERSASGKNRRKSKRPNEDVLRRFGQKLLAVLIALVLIVIVIAVAFGDRIKQSIENHEEFNGRWLLSLLDPEKYSYGSDPADMKDYFKLFSDDDVAIILQDERIEAHAKYVDKTVYFSLDTVRDLFTKRFYVNQEENLLLYSTSDQVIRNVIGESSYTKDGQSVPLGCVAARYGKDGTLYIAADYVRLFADFDYAFFTDDKHSNRVQVRTRWEEERIATVKSATWLREKGGIKSPVLREMQKGDEVKVLEVMENWSKVKTDDAFIGFVENKTLNEAVNRTPTPATGAYHPEKDYVMTPAMSKVMLGWHQTFDKDDGTEMEKLTANATGMNVVSPTWFILQDESGAYKSGATKSYVDRAHAKGYQVWALVENMETDFDEYALFSSSERRASLIEALMNDAQSIGFDGINMDIELTDAKLSKTGPHYVQFLRELSIACHKAGLSLSVDVPPPTESNKGFDIEELGYVCDYLVLMAYDEHYAGSEPGSVASLGFVEKSITDVLEKYHFPVAKLVCGVPFYTRLWRIEGSDVKSEAISMGKAAEWISTRGLESLWREEEGQYFVEYVDGTATYRMWQEEKDSISAKIGVIRGKGVTSVAGWKLGLESDGIWGLMDSALQ